MNYRTVPLWCRKINHIMSILSHKSRNKWLFACQQSHLTKTDWQFIQGVLFINSIYRLVMVSGCRIKRFCCTPQSLEQKILEELLNNEMESLFSPGMGLIVPTATRLLNKLFLYYLYNTTQCYWMTSLILLRCHVTKQQSLTLCNKKPNHSRCNNILSKPRFHIQMQNLVHQISQSHSLTGQK